MGLSQTDKFKINFCLTNKSLVFKTLIPLTDISYPRSYFWLVNWHNYTCGNLFILSFIAFNIIWKWYFDVSITGTLLLAYLPGKNNSTLKSFLARYCPYMLSTALNIKHIYTTYVHGWIDWHIGFHYFVSVRKYTSRTH